MKKLLFVFFTLLPVSALANPLLQQLEAGLYDNASPINQVQLVLTPKERAALELSKAFWDRNVPPVLTENGRVTYAYGLTIPAVVCAPFMVTDIELEAGEFVNEVVLGDTSRWQVTLARAGNPEATHLIVKPLDAGLHTTAIITTDKRLYHLEFRSQAKGHMSYVGFVYPEDVNRQLQQQIAAQRKQDSFQKTSLPTGQTVDVAKLGFAYEVQGRAAWKPVQVYNDGRQTFIRLPKSVQQGELPVLMLRNREGDALVNYRVQDTTLIVDELFKEAVLLAGVGRSQEKITIRKLD